VIDEPISEVAGIRARHGIPAIRARHRCPRGRCAAGWTGNDAVYRPASRWSIDFLAALARGEPDRRLKAAPW